MTIERNMDSLKIYNNWLFSDALVLTFPEFPIAIVYYFLLMPVFHFFIFYFFLNVYAGHRKKTHSTFVWLKVMRLVSLRRYLSSKEIMSLLIKMKKIDWNFLKLFNLSSCHPREKKIRLLLRIMALEFETWILASVLFRTMQEWF